MRELLIVVAIILLASLVLNGYFIWDRAQAEKDKISVNREWQHRIEVKDIEISMANRRTADIYVKMHEDSTEHLRSTEGLKTANSSLTRKIASLRPLLEPEIAKNDTLRAYIQATDSLLATKDSLLYRQEVFCQLQVTDLKEIISMTQQKYEAQVQISKLWEQSAVEYEQESNKLRKRAKFKNIVIYGLGGVVLWMAIKD